jgi:DNA invertase Pin-like site-specific DNA recombinase
MARLSNMKVEKIKKRLQAGESIAAVARSERVGYQTVWRIKNNKSRAKEGRRKVYRILTPKERQGIIDKRADGWNLARIAERYDVAESTVSRVISGVTSVHQGAM